ncbi:MAG: hypothetical protein N4A45_13340 [Flavobacteriales bacterium]|jgi:hypothetical protein|nr:hypothetical protein [Flavobacteriales bacterium]
MKLKNFLLLAGLSFTACDTISAQGLSSDYFEIKIQNKSTSIWNDSGSGSRRYVAIWKPVTSSGYFHFGHIISRKYNYPSNKKPVTITLKPKRGYEHLFSKPNSFTKIWDDAGSGADKGVNIFKANCKSGYVALGMVASSSSKFHDPNFRCVKEVFQNRGETVSIVTKADYQDLSNNPKKKLAFWDDALSDAKVDISMWKPIMTSPPADENTACLTPNTFFANTGDDSHGSFPDGDAFAINLQFKGIKKNTKIKKRLPKYLDRPEQPSPSWLSSFQEIVKDTIPFFAVQDKNYDSQIEQFQKNPVYYVTKTTKYKFLDGLEAKAKDESLTISVSTEMSTESNYDNSLGIAVGISAGFEAGWDFLGKATVNGSVSVEGSYSHSWGGSESKTESITKEHPLEVKKGWYGCLLQTVVQTVVRDMKNRVVVKYTSPMGHVERMYWIPQNEREGGGSIDTKNTVILKPGAKIVADKKYYSANKNFYVIFQAKDGNLVIYTKDNKHVWNMYVYAQRILNDKRNFLHGKGLLMQNDGNLKITNAKGGYHWTLFTKANQCTKNSSLVLTNEGKLILVDSNNETVWIGNKF